MGKEKLWTKSFMAAFLSNLFTAHSFYIVLACMPLFVMDNLRLSEYHVGFVMGAFSITGVLVRPFAGLLVDTAGRYKVYVFAVFVLALCTMSYIFAVSFVTITLFRLVHGIGWGLTSTAGSTVAADVVPASRRAEGLGYYAVTMSVGMALGPALGVFLWDKLPYKQVFIVCALLACFALVAALFVRLPHVEKSSAGFSLGRLIEKRVLGISVMQFFYGISYGSIMSFAIIYGKRLGVENSGLFFMLFAVVVTVLRPIVGRKADESGPGNMMGVGFIVLMAAMLMLSFAKGKVPYFGAALLVGLGAAIVMPLLVAMAMNVVAPNRRGAANATAFMSFDAGIGLGSVIFGKIASATSISTMYLASFAVLFIPLIFYYAYERRHYARLLDDMKHQAG